MSNVRHKELLRSLKFLLFSISAGVIEIAAFSLLNELTGWSYWPCYLIALVLSVLWNFTLNRRYTFQSASNVPAAMIKVCLRRLPRYLAISSRKVCTGMNTW